MIKHESAKRRRLRPLKGRFLDIRHHGVSYDVLQSRCMDDGPSVGVRTVEYKVTNRVFTSERYFGTLKMDLIIMSTGYSWPNWS